MADIEKPKEKCDCGCGHGHKKTNGWMIATIVLAALLAVSVAVNICGLIMQHDRAGLPQGNMRQLPEGGDDTRDMRQSFGRDRRQGADRNDAQKDAPSEEKQQ